MKMLGIRRYVLTIEQLRIMRPEDRAFFILAGHAVNELVVLLGILEAIRNTTIQSSVEREARATQEMTILRVVLGKLFESWQLIEKGMLGSPLGRAYVPKLAPPISGALDILKKAYGASNLLSRIRNSYSFHYSLDTAREIPTGIENLPSELGIYVGSVPRHTLFFVSEEIMGRALLRDLGAKTLAEGTVMIWSEGSRIARATIEVLAGFLMEIYSIHANMGSESEKFVEVGVPNPPMASSMALPYFTIPEVFLAPNN